MTMMMMMMMMMWTDLLPSAGEERRDAGRHAQLPRVEVQDGPILRQTLPLPLADANLAAAHAQHLMTRTSREIKTIMMVVMVMRMMMMMMVMMMINDDRPSFPASSLPSLSLHPKCSWSYH
jgi:hypothetical protein